MKIISLNIWGGRIYRPLINFIRKYSHEVDIFCFQEVFDNAIITRSVHTDGIADIFKRIGGVLQEHEGFFIEEQTKEEGLAIFYRRSIDILDSGHGFVFLHKDSMQNNDARTLGRAVQYISIAGNPRTFIGNFHGLWNGLGKTDSPDRILQSMKVKRVLERFSGHRILVGDFNLLPDSLSMEIISEGMRNLIVEAGIKSTRSSLYSKSSSPFSDYILISPEIKVIHFEVLQDTVSDHLPLLLDID